MSNYFPRRGAYPVLQGIARALFSLTLILCGSRVFAAEENILNVAILEIPDRYFADIPRTERVPFLLLLSGEWSDNLLDYAHGWLHFYSDNPYADHGATSQLYVKLLPRKENTPLVFIHMPKPVVDGSKPRKNQTFILERWGNEWRDVTSRFIPAQVDLTMDFVPRRKTATIQVAPYVRYKRPDGRGYGYKWSEHRILDLIWNGDSFQMKTPEKTTLDHD